VKQTRAAKPQAIRSVDRLPTATTGPNPSHSVEDGASLALPSTAGGMGGAQPPMRGGCRGVAPLR
jgi:hypothetical protein